MRDDKVEDRRLTVSLGIVAAGIAVKAWGLSVDWHHKTLVGTAVGTLYISSGLAALYLLLTMAAMKYKENDRIGGVPFTDKFRRFCFNFAVDAFGFNFLVWLSLVVGLLLKHFGVEVHYFRYGMLVAAITILLYALVVEWRKARGKVV